MTVEDSSTLYEIGRFCKLCKKNLNLGKYERRDYCGNCWHWLGRGK